MDNDDPPHVYATCSSDGHCRCALAGYGPCCVCGETPSGYYPRPATLADVTAERDALRAQVESLRRALGVYGEHGVRCQVLDDADDECTCGLAAARAGAGGGRLGG